jgi:hypothetical protein
MKPINNRRKWAPTVFNLRKYCLYNLNTRSETTNHPVLIFRHFFYESYWKCKQTNGCCTLRIAHHLWRDVTVTCSRRYSTKGRVSFGGCFAAEILTRAEWTPFQTHCYSENLEAPGIESGTSGLAARNSDYYTTRLTTVRDLPRWPRDTSLSTKIGIKFRRQMAVGQSV